MEDRRKRWREEREVWLVLRSHMRAIGSNSPVGCLVVMREGNKGCGGEEGGLFIKMKDNEVLCVQYVHLLC